MGRDITFKYRVEYTVSSGRQTPSGWREKAQGQIPGDGKPTAANLERHMTALVTSMKPGGCNDHVTATFGQGAIPHAARLVRQADDTVMATWTQGGSQ